ncbi:MAG: carboxypeptidase-like regulatory domain-containing protein [Trueperaceae bacterium]
MTLAAETQQARATASSTVEILALQQDASQGFHTYELEIAIRGRVDTRHLPASALDGLGGVEMEVQGRGALWDGDPGELLIALKNSADLSQRRNQVSYRHPDFSLSAGDQSIKLGSLLPSIRGFGLAGAVHPQDSIVGVRGFGALDDGELTYGAGLNVEPVPDFVIEGQVVYADGSAVVAVESNVSTRLRDGGLGILAVQPAVNLATLASGVYAATRAVGNDYNLRGYFRYEAPDFEEGDQAQASYGVSGRLRSMQQADVWLSGSYSQLDMAPAKRVQAYSGGLDGLVEGVHWSVRYNHARKWDTAENSHEFGVRATATVPLAEDATLRTVGWWEEEQDLLTGINSRIVGVDVTGYFPLMSGRFKAGVEAEFDMFGVKATQLGALLGWDGAVTDYTRLGMDAQVIVGDKNRVDLSVGGSHDLADGSTFAATVSGSIPWNGASRVKGQVGVTVPVSLVIGRKKDVAEVSGRIVDGRGVGVQGVVVWLAGFTDVTAEDGTFIFPAAPLGTHAITLRGMKPGYVTLPALPLKLEIVEGDNAEVEFELFRAGVLQGRVELQVPESAGSAPGSGVVVGAGGPVDPGRLLGGITLVVTGPGVDQRVAVNGDGTFRLTHLSPGEWQVRAMSQSLPEYYRLETMSQTVTLREGGEASVSFSLIPVQRRIRFTGGGVLGNGTK